MKRAWLVVALVVAAMVVAGAQQKEYADLKFKVVKEANGKPVRNAGVVLHPVDKEGKQERGGLELKTDAEGNAALNSIPYGKLRVQVLARGFQTYGEDYEIDKPEMEIIIKLKKPQGQYSIYEKEKKQ
jgi:uncharacterized GH25 family protein